MSKGPRILIVDLESLPNLPEALRVWPSLSNYPGLTLKASISTIICFGWKVYGEKKTHCINAWDFPQWEKNVNDDSEICKAAYEIMCKADVIVTQNGKSFDWKFLQTRFLHNNLKTLPKIQHIDTKLLARANLLIFNNSLKQLARFLTDTEKQENEGWELWVKVHGRQKSAMREMAEYCRQDVVATEKVFRRLLPFVKEMPNFNMFRRDGAEVCPNCGSHHTQRRGKDVTKAKIFVRLQCRDCGTWFRLNSKDKVRTL